MANRAELLFERQRSLRTELLDRSAAISLPSARDLAAHLLLRLDSCSAIWSIAGPWMRDRLAVDIANGGFATPEEPFFLCGAFDSRLDDDHVPFERVCNRELGVMRMWRRPDMTVISSIADQRDLSIAQRQALLATGARAKVVATLRSADGPFAVVSLALASGRSNWRAEQLDGFASVTQQVLAPILDAARALDASSGAPSVVTAMERRLTAAEYRVAELAAAGLSYKGIARRLDRSPHTIDHQLRQIREKLQIPTHAKLVHFLASGGLDRIAA